MTLKNSRPPPCCWPASGCSPTRPRPTSRHSNRRRSSRPTTAAIRLISVTFSKLAGSNLAKADTLNETLTTYLAGKPLNADQQNEINRLLGLYTRIKYGKAATETLRELVAIPTFQSRACHSTRTRSSSRSPKNQDPGRGLRSEIPQHRQPGL